MYACLIALTGTKSMMAATAALIVVDVLVIATNSCLAMCAILIMTIVVVIARVAADRTVMATNPMMEMRTMTAAKKTRIATDVFGTAADILRGISNQSRLGRLPYKIKCRIKYPNNQGCSCYTAQVSASKENGDDTDQLTDDHDTYIHSHLNEVAKSNDDGIEEVTNDDEPDTSNRDDEDEED